MDGQDGQDKPLKHGDITQAVIGCAFEVINELGAGFLESVYEKAMALALRQRGVTISVQHPIKVLFRGQCVGEFYADLLVEDKIIVELKAAKAIVPEHQAQIINYLNATGVEVGLLINFGNPKLEYKRFTRSKNFNMDMQDGEMKSCKSCPSMLNCLLESGRAKIVPKEKVAANGDYNLSGERYREGGAKTHIFPLAKLSEVCTVNPRKSQLAEKPETRVSFVPMATLNEHRISFQPSDEKQLSEVSASYTYFEQKIQATLARIWGRRKVSHRKYKTHKRGNLCLVCLLWPTSSNPINACVGRIERKDES